VVHWAAWPLDQESNAVSMWDIDGIFLAISVMIRLEVGTQVFGSKRKDTARFCSCGGVGQK
jgi:hypothetical protein